MPQCCVPRCFNRSESKTEPQLSFYRFPTEEKEKKKWVQQIRRADFTPTCNSRVCSWHFPHGKAAGPTRFAWNEGKTFLLLDRYCHAGNRKKPMLREDKVSEQVQAAGAASKAPPSTSKSLVVLQVENDMLRRDNERLKQQLEKQKQTFSFSQISSCPDRVQFYTGLPDAATVLFVETLLSKFELKYHSDWAVQSMPLVDQLLMTLMKLKLNCAHLDLATRFSCSTATVTNIVSTITCALCDILYLGEQPSLDSQESGVAKKLLQDLTQLGMQRLEILMVRL